MNASYEITRQPSSVGPYSVACPNGTTQATFVVRRTAAGTAQDRFTMVDDCGTSPTFVGAGPATGW